MAERGGKAAADGFQYQYLMTLEALLDTVEGGHPDVAAALIEPTGSPADGSSHDPDAIDFALVDEHRRPIVVAQVKSDAARGPSRTRAGHAVPTVDSSAIAPSRSPMPARLTTTVRTTSSPLLRFG